MSSCRPCTNFSVLMPFCLFVLCFLVSSQVVSVAGDDDADFAFGVAQVTAGSFRLKYEDETTDCIGCVT